MPGLKQAMAVAGRVTAFVVVSRQARLEMFRPFTGPARWREQVGRWLCEPGSTILVAEGEEGVIGLAVLLTRPASSFAGAVPCRGIEIDNLVVRADRRGERVGHHLLAASVEWARQRHATHVEVAVHVFNRGAHAPTGSARFQRGRPTSDSSASMRRFRKILRSPSNTPPARRIQQSSRA
jgi:GNAT superfamily N-acetyltransferase